MINFLDFHFGRLGNRMFQSAFLYAFARSNNIDFYFQNPEWFKGYENEIKSLFKQSGEMLDYVAIHVRRGTNPQNPNEPAYNKNSFYTDLSQTDYYDKAIDYFKNEKFLVFSDNIGYCKEKWGNDPRFSFSEKSELEDFNLMSRCKHQIIANSTFSWWAAYLNQNPDKIILAPEETQYYADGIVRTKYPAEFTQIKCNKK